VQRVDGSLIAFPETVATAADVPVGEHVEKLAHLRARVEQIVALECSGGGFDERARLGDDVAVEHVRTRRAEAAALVLGVGVQREEVPRVPQRQDRLAHGVADAGLGDRKVGAAQDRRRQQIPAHRIGAVSVENSHRVGIVTQAL